MKGLSCHLHANGEAYGARAGGHTGWLVGWLSWWWSWQRTPHSSVLWISICWSSSGPFTFALISLSAGRLLAGTNQRESPV